MQNPCYNTLTKTDCPRRTAGCAVGCKEWADYVKAKDEMYLKRYNDGTQSYHRESEYLKRKMKNRRTKRRR